MSVIVLLFLLALSVRLVPLQFSELPYNLDGFPLVRISEMILETGALPNHADYSGLLGYNMKLPVFSTALAIFSLVIGVQPMEMLPYFCALFGTLAVMFIYVLARAMTRNDLVAFSAGMFAALSGLFVYVTTAAMKQLLAIMLLCFVYYLYIRRRDWRFRTSMMLVLVILPFTHHLTTLIALLALSFALAGTAFRRSEHHVNSFQEFMLDAVTGPGILIISVLYYKSVTLEIASEVINANDIVLLASVAVLAAVLARMLSMTVQSKPWFFLGGKGKQLGFSSIFDEKVIFLICAIAVLYINSRMHIFTGAQMTSGTLLKLMFPYMMLAVIGLMGFNVLRYSKFPLRNLVVGMFLAPLSLMIFSALRGLDMFGFMVAYRAYNFIDIPLAVAVGVGMAYIVAASANHARDHDFFKPLPAFAMAIFIMTCAMALPLAYNSREAFAIREVTQDYELTAMEWASVHNSKRIFTDQRYSDIIGPYFGAGADRTGPWKLRDGSIAEGSILLASKDWSTEGAQMYPFGPVVLKDESFSHRLETWNVCYAGGPEGREMVVAIVR